MARLIRCIECGRRALPARDSDKSVWCISCWARIEARMEADARRAEEHPEESRAQAEALLARVLENDRLADEGRLPGDWWGRNPRG